MDIVQLIMKRFAPSVHVPLASLKKLEWGLRKKCFLLLFSNSKSFSEHHEKLMHLMEIRKKQVNSEKRAGLDISPNSESESIYRTSFIRVVIDGLIMIRWPPATAAFSDPLNDLLFDEKVFRQALSYIYLNYFGDIPKKEIVETKDLRTFTNPNRTKSLFESSDYSEIEFEGQSADRINEKSVNNAIFDDHSWNEISTIKENDFKGDDGLSDIVGDDENSNKYVKTIRILQSQNSALQASLKSIHYSVNMRDNAERRMEAILIDLTQAVNEMVLLSGGESSAKTNSSLSADDAKNDCGDQDKSFITEEEDSEFQKEVIREKITKAASSDPRRRIISPAKAKNTNTNKNAITGDKRITESAIIWTATSKRLIKLNKEWDAARKSARNGSIRNLIDIRKEKRECEYVSGR